MALFKIGYISTDPECPTRAKWDQSFWVTPPDYSTKEARDSFTRQSPSSTVFSIVRLQD